MNRFLKFYEAAGAGGDSGGGAGAGDAGAAAAGSGAAGGASAAGAGGAAGQGAAAAGASGAAGSAANAGGILPPADLRTLINEKGEFVSGDWAKQLGLPEGFASKFKTIDGALKSYANLEKSLGSANKVPVPGANSTPEEIALFRSKIGVPDKPEGYEIKTPADLPVELWNPEHVKGFQAEAHKLGLTPTQAAGIAAWQAQQLGTDYKAQMETINGVKTAAEAALAKEWGGKDSETYKTNVALAERGAAAIGLTPEVLTSTPELSNNPHFIKAMQSVAMKLGEDKGARQQGGAGGFGPSTPEQAKAEIQRIRADPKHPYNNTALPAKDREAAVAQVNRLYAIINPDQTPVKA